MRRLLFALIALVILAVAADFVAARLVEQRIANELAATYQLNREPVVRVRDFPFLLSLARRRFGTVDVAAHDVRARGVNAAQLEVHLHDVVVPSEVFQGRRAPIQVGWADGQLRLSERELNRLVGGRLRGGRVELTGSGVRISVRTQILGRPVQATVTGRLTANGNRLSFNPTNVELDGDAAQLDQATRARVAELFRFTAELPPLPAGVRVERVDTEPDALILSGRAGAIQVPT